MNYNPSDAYGVWNFVTEPESYNSVTGQWTSLALMPHRRSQVAVTAVAQKIYVIGGLPHPGNLFIQPRKLSGLLKPYQLENSVGNILNVMVN